MSTNRTLARARLRGNLPTALPVGAALLLLACGGKSASSVTPLPDPGPVAVPDAGPAPIGGEAMLPAIPNAGREGCAQGDVKSCDALAEYWGDRQIAAATDLALGKSDAAILHAACDERGISSACMGLAFMYKYGTATGAKDKGTSDKYWGRVAELGDLNGYRGKPLSDEGEQALAATVRECDEGRARACGQLGWAAYSAVMQKKSPKNSFEGYRKGCVLGSGLGCRWAGHLVRVYHLGTTEQSHAYLRRGCEALSSVAACTELGHLVEDVLKKPEEAKALYEPACKSGNREACFSLALTLDLDGTAPKRAAELYLVACDAGEKESCSGLAKHVKEGCKLDLDVGGDADLTARSIAAARAYCAKVEDAPGCENLATCK